MDLWIPGPTSVPSDVREAFSQQVVGHRTEEFSTLVRDVTGKAKKILNTDNDVFFLTSSGTGAMQAAVSNFFSPGDPVLICSTGAFGERFADIARTYGLEIAKYAVEWGQALNPTRLDEILETAPHVKAVFVTHNETSTGVTNDLEVVGQLCKKYEKLLVVDSISGAGALPLEVDRWGIDVLVTSVQKCWMTPPGLSMITVSDQAWEYYERSRLPEFYFDLGKARDKFNSAGQTPWTPAVSTFRALNRAMDNMLAEGMQNVFDRHKLVASIMREKLQNLGFTLVPDKSCASDVVTAVFVPEGFDAEEIRTFLREEYFTEVAGGKGKFAGKVLRIGHMGTINLERLDRFLALMQYTLGTIASRK